MRQLILPGDRGDDSAWTLEGPDSKYLTKVLRLKAGDSFDAMDEAGHHFRCSIIEYSSKSTLIALVSASSPAANGCGLGGQPEPAPATPALRIALVQALPKGPRMDLIIRQAVEAGVADIFPLNSRHCITRERSGQEMAEKRLRRERIVRSALQQSGSALMTRIHETTDPESLFHILAAEGYDPDGSLYLLCHELPIPGKSIHENCAGNPKSVVLLIGPEGGFSPEEIEFFIRNGCALIHFEGPVLRTETAALYAVAAIKTILMEHASWKLSR